MGLDPISYIIIERHDKRFDGYRVIGKNTFNRYERILKKLVLISAFFIDNI